MGIVAVEATRKDRGAGKAVQVGVGRSKSTIAALTEGVVEAVDAVADPRRTEDAGGRFQEESGKATIALGAVSRTQQAAGGGNRAERAGEVGVDVVKVVLADEAGRYARAVEAVGEEDEAGDAGEVVAEGEGGVEALGAEGVVGALDAVGHREFADEVTQVGARVEDVVRDAGGAEGGVVADGAS